MEAHGTPDLVSSVANLINFFIIINRIIPWGIRKIQGIQGIWEIRGIRGAVLPM